MLKTRSFKFERGIFTFFKPMNYEQFKRSMHMCEEHAKRNRLVGIKKWNATELICNG
jgi:hypothetical protein